MAAYSAIRPSAAHRSRWMLPLWMLAAMVAAGYLMKEFVSAPGKSQGSRSSHPRVERQVYSQPLRPLVGDKIAPAEEEDGSWSFLASSVIFGAVAGSLAMLAATKSPEKAADMEAAVRSSLATAQGSFVSAQAQADLQMRDFLYAADTTEAGLRTAAAVAAEDFQVSLAAAQAQADLQMRDFLYAADTTEAGLRTAAAVAAEDFQKGVQAFQQDAEAGLSGLSPQLEEAVRAAQSKALELSAGARMQMETLSQFAPAGVLEQLAGKEAAVGAGLTLSLAAGSQQLGENTSPAAALPAATPRAMKTLKVSEKAELRNFLLSVRRA